MFFFFFFFSFFFVSVLFSGVKLLLPTLFSYALSFVWDTYMYYLL